MIQLYLITGFLGAGKTTFLKNLIQCFSTKRMQLIVNEFGKEGIDGKLLSELGAKINEINNGSIFCSCRLDRFEEVLMQAITKSEEQDILPDVILIEASGLSNPTNIRKILEQPGRYEQITYRGCICLVDARNFHKVYATASVVKKQLAVSDMLLLNKTDLVEEETLQETEEQLRSIRPEAPIYRTSYGQIESEWIENLKVVSSEDTAKVVQQADITLRSYTILLHNTFTPYELQKFVEMFVTDTYRVKGFVEMEGNIFLVDCVSNLYKATIWNQQNHHLSDEEDGHVCVNKLVVLSGQKLPTKKSIMEAVSWYKEKVIQVE